MSILDLYLNPGQAAAWRAKAEALGRPLDGEGGLVIAAEELRARDASAVWLHVLLTVRQAREAEALGLRFVRWQVLPAVLKRLDGGPLHLFDRGGVADCEVGSAGDPEDVPVSVVTAVKVAAMER